MLFVKFYFFIFIFHCTLCTIWYDDDDNNNNNNNNKNKNNNNNNTVVDSFTKNGGTANLCAIDLSKAFV